MIHLLLPLLEAWHCRQLTKHAFKCKVDLPWERLPVFELALLFCGGWPRVLEIFLKEARTWKGYQNAI